VFPVEKQLATIPKERESRHLREGESDHSTIWNTPGGEKQVQEAVIINDIPTKVIWVVLLGMAAGIVGALIARKGARTWTNQSMGATTGIVGALIARKGARTWTNQSMGATTGIVGAIIARKGARTWTIQSMGATTGMAGALIARKGARTWTIQSMGGMGATTLVIISRHVILDLDRTRNDSAIWMDQNIQVAMAMEDIIDHRDLPGLEND